MKKRKIVSAVTVIAVVCMLPGLVLADPDIDGKIAGGEYSAGYDLNFRLEGGGSVGGGHLYYQLGAGGDTVNLAFIQPKTLVDNSYGATAVGWGDYAPSGKRHNFSDLLNSDKAQFIFTTVGDPDTVLLDVTLDYLYADGSSYSSGLGSRDGKVEVGDAADVLAAATSLDYNLNRAGGTGYNLTTDSPLTFSQEDSSDESYALAGSGLNFPGWIFDVIYEFEVDISVFGGSMADFTDKVEIKIVHDSPNKQDRNKVYPEFDDPTPIGVIPEPLTMFGLICGVGGLGGYLRRRFGTKGC